MSDTPKSRMFVRIMDAMPEDAEVQEFCSNLLAKEQARAEKSERKMNMALTVFTMRVDEPVSAREFANLVNEECLSDEEWTTRSASYYLRRMVEMNLAVPVESRSRVEAEVRRSSAPALHKIKGKVRFRSLLRQKRTFPLYSYAAELWRFCL